MARPRKDGFIDLKVTHDLNAGLIERLACPVGKEQAFLRDSESSGLRVRVTAAGHKAFIFEGKVNRKTVRRTIGDANSWSIKKARAEANKLRVMLDNGQDPRELDRQRQAEEEQTQRAAIVQALTVGEVWQDYIEKRRPFWGIRHYRDHQAKAAPGGLPAKSGVTKPGPLACLMPLRMVDLSAERVEAWAAAEGKTRPTSARLAWRLLKVFLTWCAEQKEYQSLMPDKNPAKTKRSREALGEAGVKTDALGRGQLAAWFQAVQQLHNPAIAAYLQVLLLTGARPGEVLSLRWEDVNAQWKAVTIRDKVEGIRVIPLTPFVENLLAALPRRNEWVFASTNSATGRLTEPNHQHARACAVAGVGHISLHGLRRSFKGLTDWMEAVPVGVVAQIQGHKPSATVEKHYTNRPLELLALHHNRIEAWILEQAGIMFDAKAEPGKLRVVG